MTESEAKTKWCPMVVFMLGGGMVRNRDACYDNDGTHCIGSACMMWRWAKGYNVEGYAKGKGRCGLAGKL